MPLPLADYDDANAVSAVVDRLQTLRLNLRARADALRRGQNVEPLAGSVAVDDNESDEEDVEIGDVEPEDENE